MKHRNKIEGEKGEILACQYLKKNNYKILQTNYKNKIGEIDIIAEKNGKICFVEVKERNSDRFGLPCEAVNRQKQIKILKVAQLYLIKNKIFKREISFSVLEILDGKINLIENAFEL